MSAPAARRARLLRLRTTEHRVAVARLIAAESAHAAAVSVSDRLTQLRGSIGAVPGSHAGHRLQSLFELSDRLDRVQIGLQHTLDAAIAVRDARSAERMAARHAEERTAHVHASASRREANERELRAAAALPLSRIKRGSLS